MKTTFINEPTEIKLQNKLRELEAQHDSMIKVINVYPSSKGFTCWYYHDIQKAGFPPKKVEATKKKVTKKKVTKKVN
jgi:hypothetical protein